MPREKKKLREVICDGLKIQIDEIWAKAEEYHDKQKGDNIQGRKHCETVDENLYRLIFNLKREEMRNIELFLLSATACVHDIGKIVSEGLENHGEKSKEIILEKYEKLGLRWGQTVGIAFIASVHDHGQLNELPPILAIGSEKIDIIKLAAIFRLADMLDTSYPRAPEILGSILYPKGNIPSKWRGRQSITGWYVDEKNKIILQAAPKKEVDIESVYTLHGMMKDELLKIAPHLRIYGYPCELGRPHIIDISLERKFKEITARQRPFPGMGCYTRQDAEIFKGRDKEIHDLLSSISAHSITLLIGESGAGKTSLVQAGLFPWLERMSWKFVWTRPLDNPKRNIARVIWSDYFKGEFNDRTLLDVMRKVAEECKPHKVLIVIDQFEDVLNCTQKTLDDFSAVLTVVQTGTSIRNLRILISFREDAYVRLNSRLFEKIIVSPRSFPSIVLERLTRDGAKQAFIAGLKNGGFELEPGGTRPLLEVILDDIQKGEDRLYPPYIQIVAETLCKKADKSNPVITRKMYLELGSADRIVGNYLMSLLDEFGSQRDKAKRVLIFLTSSAGRKAQKNLNELAQKTGIEIEKVKEIMNKMIELRIARAIDDEFEIIHDYLGEIVEELVKDEDRNVKLLEEQLDAFYRIFELNGAPIRSFSFLAKLYKIRERVWIDEEKYPLILSTALMKDGLGWYWLKDVEATKIIRICINLMNNEAEEVRKRAKELFLGIADREDKKDVVRMLHDENGHIRQSAREAFLRIITHEGWEAIVQMLHDENEYVQQAARAAFLRIITHEDWEEIVRMLQEENEYSYWTAREAFLRIASHEDREKVIEMLHDENKHMQQAAREAFLKVASHEDWEEIVQMLHNRDKQIQRAARAAFLRTITHEDREKVIEMLHDENKHMQQAAREAFLKVASHEDWEEIVEMLHDENEYVQQAARAAFLRIITHEDWEEIVRMLQEENEYSYWTAREAFLRIASHEDREKVIEMLHDENKHMQQAAREAFLKVASHEDWEEIVQMLHDENWHIFWTAREAFLKVASHEDRKKIVKLLHDEKEYVQRASREAFLKIVNHEDKEEVTKMLNDKNEHVQRTAREAFSKLAAHEDREKVVVLLNDENWHIRQAAREAFLEIITHEDKEEVVEMLHNENEYVQWTAIKAFPILVAHEDKEKIIEILHDENRYIRQAAREAFLRIAAHEDWKEIVEMLHDEDKYVQQAAREAFLRIITHEDWKEIVEMLHDEDKYVQQAAREAFLRIAPDDKEHLLDLLSDQAQESGKDPAGFFEILSILDEMFYCPFSKNIQN